MNAQASPLTPPRRSRLDDDLALLSPGHRSFFRLVIGVTRVLFVLLWPLLWAGWRLRRASGHADPPPGWDLLDGAGHPLYVVGAAVALVLGIVSTIGMVFWPFITVLGWLHSFPGAAAQGAEALARELLEALGAVSLEAAMLAVYVRHIRDGLAGK